MSDRQNAKPLGIVGAIPKFAGALVGLAVVAGKKVRLCIRNMMTVQPGPSTRIAKKPMQVQTEKKAGTAEEKKTESQQAKSAKRPVQAPTKKKGKAEGTKIKSEPKKEKRSNSPQNRPISGTGGETNVATE